LNSEGMQILSFKLIKTRCEQQPSLGLIII
jgi:hypothetical protein